MCGLEGDAVVLGVTHQVSTCVCDYEVAISLKILSQVSDDLPVRVRSHVVKVNKVLHSVQIHTVTPAVTAQPAVH